MTDKRFVVVTTDSEKRGVFGGVMESSDGNGNVVLSDARMCVHWSRDVRGVPGLASGGPTDGCRISPAAPRMELSGVICVIDCTDDARKAWEREPWSS